MLLDLRSLFEQQEANAGSASFGVTVATGVGAVVSSAVVHNGGVFYKSKPQPKPIELPRPEAPRKRIIGDGETTVSVVAVQGQGVVVHPLVVTGAGAATLMPTQAQGQGTSYRRRMSGAGAAGFAGTGASGSAVYYDRQLWNQIKEEDEWLAKVMTALGVSA